MWGARQRMLHGFFLRCRPNGRGKGDAGGLKHLAASAFRLASEHEAFVLVRDLDILQRIEVIEHISPFQLMALGVQPLLQGLAQYQGEKGTEHVATDGLIALVKNGSGVEQGFRGTKELLDHPQLFVLKRHLGGVQVGIGAQHPLAIIARLGFYSFLIHDKTVALCFEVLAVAFVTDQGFVTVFEPRAQRRDNGRPVAGLLLGLVFIEADHIATAVELYFLDLQRGRVFTAAPLGAHDLVTSGTGKHLVAHFLLVAHPHPEDVFPLACFVLEGFDRLTADHAAVGHDAHLPDGKALAQPVHHRNQCARGSNTVMNDFQVVGSAIASMIAQPDSPSAMFTNKPFRGTKVMQALFSQLGLTPTDWCCDDLTNMPPVNVAASSAPADLNLQVSLKEKVAVRIFYRYCATCHRTPNGSPPNFLYGDATQVRAKLTQCAPRILFRLHMWRLSADARPKSPMPPTSVLRSARLSEEGWRTSDELAHLKQYITELMGPSGESTPGPEELMATGYENTPACLPEPTKTADGN